MTRNPIISVEDARQALESRLSGWHDGTKTKNLQEAEALFGTPVRLPFWITATTRQKIARVLGPDTYSEGRAPSGRALAAVRLRRFDEASLVWLDVSFRKSAGAPTPPPEFSSETVESLRVAGACARRLYPQSFRLDAERDLRFALFDLMDKRVSVYPPIEGRSLAMAAVVATWSLLADEPAPLNAVYTGGLRPGVPLDRVEFEPVDALQPKAEEARRVLLPLVMPAAPSSAMPKEFPHETVRTVPELLERVFGPEWNVPTRWRVPRAELLDGVAALPDWRDLPPGERARIDGLIAHLRSGNFAKLNYLLTRVPPDPEATEVARAVHLFCARAVQLLLHVSAGNQTMVGRRTEVALNALRDVQGLYACYVHQLRPAVEGLLLALDQIAQPAAMHEVRGAIAAFAHQIGDNSLALISAPIR